MMSDGRSLETLISLASRQIWPHVLAVAHLRPRRLILLHSQDAGESRTSARHLKHLFDRASVVAQLETQLEPVPHDDFEAVQRRLADVTRAYVGERGSCAVNFTGGNKLMATAAFRWAADNDMRSFYLERGNRLTWFEPTGHDLSTRIEPLDGSIANRMDPLALLRCQLAASKVERDGERLTLNERGRALSPNELRTRIVKDRPCHSLVDIEGQGDRTAKRGDALEVATAVVLLRAGVAEVRRSVRLKVHTPARVSSRLPHAEIDLLFNWNGRLWLVDCKDRVSEESLMARLRRNLPSSISSDAEQLLNRIGDELEISPTKVLKEDMVAIDEIGGLQGQVVCVRRVTLPPEAHAYAQRNRIEVVLKKDLVRDIDRLLNPTRPASAGSLNELMSRFGR